MSTETDSLPETQSEPQIPALAVTAGSASVHFSSASDEWPTPQDFFNKCNAEFGPFDLDVCATAENAKCPRYFTKADDGLAQVWSGRVWMNPPYGREIGAWMAKARRSSQAGALVAGRRARGLPRARTHRHGMVARLRGQGHGALHSRAAEIRGAQELCAVPLGPRGLLSAEQPSSDMYSASSVYQIRVNFPNQSSCEIKAMIALEQVMDIVLNANAGLDSGKKDPTIARIANWFKAKYGECWK